MAKGATNMNLQELDRLVYQIERDEIVLEPEHKIVKAMQLYLNDHHKANFSLAEVRGHIIWSCRHYSINCTDDLLTALDYYREEQYQ